ncbi:MAG: type IV pilus modification PilV family protein [Planctomycetota bacterium]
MRDRVVREVTTRSGFSLAELLLAVFILGIGVIAIAALFPAGIAQQRQSVDDTIGPLVADNALSIIRSKVEPGDFGTREDFKFNYVSPTIVGDWPWSRPAFFFDDTPVTLPDGTPVDIPKGSIGIFNNVGVADTNSEIPWNPVRYDQVAYPNGPFFTITKGERYYPMHSVYSSPSFPPRPQYVWDCMFRRFQGRVLVAIFVYRVTIPGGGGVEYAVPRNYSSPAIPPLPISLDLTLGGPLPWHGNPWDADADLVTPAIEPFVLIPDTGPDQEYDPSDQAQVWQAPGQWMLDQNNNVHRVLSGRRTDRDGPVELVRPVPSIPPLGVFFLDRTVPDPARENVVSNLWYIPLEVELDTDGDGEGDLPATLTPVYSTVREL